MEEDHKFSKMEEETEKDAEVENPDHVDEDIIELNQIDNKFYYRVASEEMLKKQNRFAHCAKFMALHSQLVFKVG